MRKKSGVTALLDASWYGHEGIVRALLEADDRPDHVEAHNKHSMTALMWAAIATRGLPVERRAGRYLVQHEYTP